MNTALATVRTHPRKGNRAELERIQAETNQLFSKCLFAFHCFANLGELSENMRILSLNAELAAGRAGDKGNAVRALTQYTRELVARLNGINHRILQLKSETYNQSANALRILNQLHLFARTLNELNIRKGEHSAIAQDKTTQSRDDKLASLLGDIRGMTRNVNNLASEAAEVSELVSQAGSIATNIAIEASSAGNHEAEFGQVAKSMRGYVAQLHEMVDMAGNPVREAGTIGGNLQNLTQQSIRS